MTTFNITWKWVKLVHFQDALLMVSRNSCMLSINRNWQYSLEPELSKILKDLKEKPGFSINIGSLGAKTTTLFNFRTTIFGKIKYSKTLTHSVVNLVCSLILNFLSSWRLWLVLIKGLYILCKIKLYLCPWLH